MYVIKPKTDDDATKIDGRYYYVNTALEDAKIDGRIMYKDDGIVGINDFSINVNEWDYGLYELNISVTGKIPSISPRLEEKAILWIDVQDAEDNVLPSVVVTIVNPTKFTDDINTLKDRLSKLKSEIVRLDEMGADTVELNKYIKLASDNITLAESYYNDKEYVKSDRCLKSAENYLNKVESGLNKTEALFLYDQIKEKLDDLKIAMVKLEYLIQQAKNEGKTMATYEIELTEIKSKYEDIIDKSDKIKNYIEQEEYCEAKKLANKILKDLDPLNKKVKYMITEIQGEALTTPTKTPTSGGFSFKFDTKILTYIGIGIAVIVGGSIAAIAISKWRQKRKWDELR